jgi:hypothetical protein
MIFRRIPGFLFAIASLVALPGMPWAADVAPEVLAFYYGWYGNPRISGEWRRWEMSIRLTSGSRA